MSTGCVVLLYITLRVTQPETKRPRGPTPGRQGQGPCNQCGPDSVCGCFLAREEHGGRFDDTVPACALTFYVEVNSRAPVSLF